MCHVEGGLNRECACRGDTDVYNKCLWFVFIPCCVQCCGLLLCVICNLAISLCYVLLVVLWVTQDNPCLLPLGMYCTKRAVGCNMIVTNLPGNSFCIIEPSDKRHLSTKSSHRIITYTHTSVKGLENRRYSKWRSSKAAISAHSRTEMPCFTVGYSWHKLSRSPHSFERIYSMHLAIKSNHLWPPVYSLTCLSWYENN